MWGMGADRLVEGHLGAEVEGLGPGVPGHRRASLSHPRPGWEAPLSSLHRPLQTLPFPLPCPSSSGQVLRTHPGILRLAVRLSACLLVCEVRVTGAHARGQEEESVKTTF